MNCPTAPMSAITNVPKREESRARRHFHQIIISKVSRWKCNYCDKNYGLNTSTTSLWKHLEKTHPEKLTVADTKQKSGNEWHNCSRTHLSDHSLPKIVTQPTQSHFVNDKITTSPLDNNQSTGEESVLTKSPPRLLTGVSLIHYSATDKRKHSIPDYSDLGNVIKKVIVNSQSVSNEASQDSNEQCHKPLAKRLAIEDGGIQYVGSSPQLTGYGFGDLVSDVAMLKPSDLEHFQEILLQNTFFQQSWWDDQSMTGGVAKDKILSRQRDRIIDTMLNECGWKFDMNVYPVSLFNKRYLVLDLVYRKSSGEHRVCFLDCLELPDEYPMELLSIMIFRKLCEFHVEDKLWQVFIGNTQLKGLTDILRNIFRENNLCESLECETVDFSKQIFTVKQDTHELTISDLLANLSECHKHIKNLCEFVNQTKKDILWPSNNKETPITHSLNSGITHDDLQQTSTRVNTDFKGYSTEHIDGFVNLPSNADDNIAGITIMRVSEKIKTLQEKARHFQQEIRNIKSWLTDHLFIAYHMCSYCFYVCNDIHLCRNASASAKSYLADLLQLLNTRKKLITDLINSTYVTDGLASQEDVQQTVARLHFQLHRLIFQEYAVDQELTSWGQTIGWWQAAMFSYQQLRNTVCHYVTDTDSDTSKFARNFEKASRHVPPNVSEEKWMKYIHWKIWRDFQM